MSLFATHSWLMLRRAGKRTEDFFFRPISASGFGLMRIGWALTVLIYGLGQFADVARYYGAEGLLPANLEHIVTRSVYRFTLLHVITDPQAVVFLYALMLAACVSMILGIYPRLMTIVAVLLLFSFHERNPLSLGGGDTVLRNVGFLLMLAPCGKAFSRKRWRAQWERFRAKLPPLPPAKMPAWPMRLMLWQLMIIYVTTAWDKVLGTMWLQGTAVDSILLHTHFVRWPQTWMMTLGAASPVFTYATLIFELAWLMLLFPNSVLKYLRLTSGAVKRGLLVGGVLFHGGIFILMDVGSFSAAMMAAYLGVLTEEDFKAMRNFWNSLWFRTHHSKLKTQNSIAVLYDGHCGLCQRSVFTLLMLDHLHRLKLVDFHDAELKKQYAADIALKDLDKAMHIRFPHKKTFKGFYAVRVLTWHLPVFWIIAPMMYLPGVSFIGNKIYRRVARNRKKCAHESCGYG